jgi:hypothetical protein
MSLGVFDEHYPCAESTTVNVDPGCVGRGGRERKGGRQKGEGRRAERRQRAKVVGRRKEKALDESTLGSSDRA